RNRASPRDGVFLPPRGEVVRGEGRAEVDALSDVAADRLERLERLRVLHALGHRTQAEVVGEVDGGVHERADAGIGERTADDRAVDLDFVDREALEVRERGEARAEVVDGDLGA